MTKDRNERDGTRMKGKTRMVETSSAKRQQRPAHHDGRRTYDFYRRRSVAHLTEARVGSSCEAYVTEARVAGDVKPAHFS